MAGVIEELADRVSALVARGDLDGAGRLVESVATTQPAAHAIGYAAIALSKGDAPTAILHAVRAIDAGAGAIGLHYLALAQLLGGEPAMAIDSARKAVALDRSPRNRSSLGSVLLAAGRTEDAAGVLRQVVAETPHDYDALLNLANACAQLGDYAGAISHYARAFEADPAQTRTIQNLMNMFADVGRWLGALAALELTRTDEAPPAVAVALDVARLHMIRLIADTFPAPNVGASPDEAVVNAVASASARGSAIQLAVARMLVDLGRLDDASRFLDQIERRPLEAADRAVVLFLRGVLARHAQDPAAALALFEQALATDPTRADACVNATQLLLEEGTSTAFAKVAALIDRVPVERRTPELLFNEAACLARLERPEEARALLERVIRITGGAGRIGQVARDALRELAG